MTDERAVQMYRAADEDTPEQQTRCRNLELMVLLRALLDATWREDDAAHWTDSPQRTSDLRHRQTLRASARAWFLTGGDVQRAHVDSVAACAGLPEGWIWTLVRRFVVAGEDPAPLRDLYEQIGDRPGAKKFELTVPFVA